MKKEKAMKNQVAPKARTTTNQSSPQLVKPETHIDRLKQLQEAIACRAYELFESRGCTHGQDREDWLHAESELLRSVPIKVSESADSLTLQAELAGFEADEIQVSAEPWRLIISGMTSQSAKQGTEKDFSGEVVAKDVFRLINLPIEVDPKQVKAILRDGILNLTLPKVAADKMSRAEASAG
jgi:HSP20 family molecular chaperone IbpA